MIALIENVIQEELPQYRGPFSFVKFSTPQSGKKRDDKVLFFAFMEGATEPFACVQTVRSYEARTVIRRHHENLTKLQAHAGPFGDLFAKPLHLYDDGESIFSIETAAGGERRALTPDLLKRITQVYGRFSARLISPETLHVTPESYVEEVLATSAVSAHDRAALHEHLRILPGSDLPLPRILQHGDLTSDNLLFRADGGVSILDYDSVGRIDLAGFDMFSLALHADYAHARSRTRELLPTYLSALGVSLPHSFDAAMFAYFLTERLVRKPESNTSSKTLIEEFSRFQ